MKEKIQIINSTDLSYKDIGFIIDDIKKRNIGDTCYFGKIDFEKFMFHRKKYLLQIKYMKNYVSYDFAEIGEGK